MKKEEHKSWETVNKYLMDNASIYQFINDQTLTYINQGYTADEISNMIRLPEECLTCKYAGICNVCAAMCKAETGDFSKTPQYICRMTKYLFTLAERSVGGNEN